MIDEIIECQRLCSPMIVYSVGQEKPVDSIPSRCGREAVNFYRDTNGWPHAVCNEHKPYILDLSKQITPEEYLVMRVMMA